MRSRGASAADIAVLVVSADDSVKPQTIESIEQIKAAGIPIIVAVNKIDLPAANVDRVKQDLAKAGVQVEGFGGDVPIVPISAKQGTGIPELLDMILLVGDMKELVDESDGLQVAIVIETKIDKGKGLISTIIVKKGTLTAGVSLFEGAMQIGKVRAMVDEFGAAVNAAGPSKPVVVLGFTKLPQIGAQLAAVAIAREPQPIAKTPQFSSQEMPDFLKPIEKEDQSLNIVLKADAAGSIEAITAALPKRVKIVSVGIGDVSEADILRAKPARAIVIGFNVGVAASVAKLAQTEKVIYRTYTIIYKLLEELTDVVAGLKEIVAQERELGAGQIIAEFPFEKDRIAGTKVISGRLAKGDSVKVMHGQTEVGRTKIKSLRHGKDSITKVELGNECGIFLEPKVDFTVGDAIIAFTIG
ncbi:hypothetical protein HY409_02245 [Candidatus Gottesmanbacteria bacterium]|nr:hypothetical protein [Candidatus Gottesmanbacteria bacterium]